MEYLTELISERKRLVVSKAGKLRKAAQGDRKLQRENQPYTLRMCKEKS